MPVTLIKVHLSFDDMKEALLSLFLVTGCPHLIMFLLKNLHWLPVRSRIVFKILLLTYKILNGQSPTYLTSLINCYKPVCSLRSSDCLLLQVPNVSTATDGQRTFSFCAPKPWNTLPQTIK